MEYFRGTNNIKRKWRNAGRKGRRWAGAGHKTQIETWF